jgi:protein-disulfide isomerase
MPQKVGRKTGRKTQKAPVPVWVWTLVAVVIVAAAVAALYYYGTHPPPVKISEADVPIVTAAIPNASALHVYLFEDYQCPVCRLFETNGGYDHLFATWVQTGKVDVVFKPVDILDSHNNAPGGGSTNGAEASFCVWRLNKTDWHDYHHMVYVDQQDETTPYATPGYFRNLVQTWSNNGPHIAMSSYDACISGATGYNPAATLHQDMLDWNAIGAQGTPTLYVNGTQVNPVNNNAVVDQTIQASLPHK